MRSEIKDIPLPEDFEAGRLLFSKPCKFVVGCVELSQLPGDQFPEIAFAGRSNVGKSSLVNALTGTKALAKSSKTPGRTRQINFFNLDDLLLIADLPGYGYARAPKTQIKQWTTLIQTYLKGRANLRRTFILVDARHGLKTADRNVFKMLDVAAQSYQLVLTKCDKVSIKCLEAVTNASQNVISKHSAAHPKIAVTSSRRGDGIPELRTSISMLAVRSTNG